MISFLFAGLFGTIGFLFGLWSDKFNGYIEYPFTRELAWETSEGSPGFFKEADLKNISGRIILIHNGSFSNQTCVCERANDFNIERIIVSHPNRSCELLGKSKMNGRFDNREVRIESLLIQPFSQTLLSFMSLNPRKTSTRCEDTIVRNKGVKLNRGLVFSQGECLLLILIVAFVGLLLSNPIKNLVKVFQDAN